MTTRKGTIYSAATPVKRPMAKVNKPNFVPVKTIAPQKDASTETEPNAESIKETLNAKTKEELVDELAKLINAETTSDNTCNSDKIKNMLNAFINKYKPTPVVVPPTNKDIELVIDVYADKDKNSKGYHIYNYKVRAVNEEYPFSTDDEVKYFLKHLFGYIENSNLPVEARKEDITNMFRSYRKTIKQMPLLDPPSNKLTEGGNKKKSSAKRSQKRKTSNKQKKRGSRKSVKKH